MVTFTGVLRAAKPTVAVAACVLFTAATAFAASPKHQPNPQVVMTVEHRGAITIELFPKAAPATVAHFLDLVHRKFYDGILFHRVVPEFVAQAGDPATKGANGVELSKAGPGADTRFGNGGSGHNVKLEASLPHDRGTLGLARTPDPNTGDSQFFFNLVPNHSLDNAYCVFGKVTKGLSVMDAIKQGDKIVSVRQVSGSAREKR